MRKFFRISGYWLDTGEPFEDYIVASHNEVIGDYDADITDDHIFEYGWDEKTLESVMNDDTGINDWVLTSYEEIII